MQSQQMQIAQRREQFRVQIRKEQREKIFHMKRQIENKYNVPGELELILQIGKQKGLTKGNTLEQLFLDLSHTNTNQKGEEFALITNLLNKLNHTLPQSLQHCLSREFFEMIDQSMQWYLEASEASFLMINEDNIHRLEELTEQLMLLLTGITFHCNNLEKHCEILNFLNSIIVILLKTQRIDTINYICRSFANLVMDGNQMIVNHFIDCTIIEKVIAKFFDNLDYFNSIESLEQPLGFINDLIFHRYESFGTNEFKFILPLMYRFQQLDEPITSLRCMATLISILKNLSRDIELNRPRVHQLFNEIIDKQIVRWVTTLMMNYNDQLCIQEGYLFLLNLSQISSSYAMEQLINQDALILIQLQINENQYPQKLIYPLLANLLASKKIETKEKIKGVGILSRIVSGFILAKQQNSDYLAEVVQCIINVFEDSTPDQLKDLIKLDLAKCLIEYITEVPIEKLEVQTCVELLEVLISIFVKQPKQSKYSLLRDCRKNPVLLLRLQQILTYGEDGSEIQIQTDKILNYLL